MEWIPQFFIFALLSGLGIALIAAPLGVFTVWQKQSYFGSTLAHAALLGVSIALLMETQLTLTVVTVSLLIAWLVFHLSHRQTLSNDTVLGILAHSSLALGLILISLQDNIQIDLISYLFGDILSVQAIDLMLIGVIGIITFLFYRLHWNQLLNLTLNKELAQVEGVAAKRIQLQFVLLLSLMIAISMKIVGVLLVTSLLIIPSAAARRIARSPESMLGYAMSFGVLSVIGGLLLSFWADLPTGAAIVLIASIIFLLLLMKKAP